MAVNCLKQSVRREETLKPLLKNVVMAAHDSYLYVSLGREISKTKRNRTRS
jgi:hypothetical protein